jgi:DnaJ-class molecular chaperone
MSWTADRVETESKWTKYRADDVCICPDCNGQGVTVWGSTCHTCDGLGELRRRDVEMIRRMPGGDWR